MSRNDIREVFLNHHGKNINALIGKINPIIRGKANYMNKVVSSRAFTSLDRYLFTRQVRYVKRMHPQKSKKWTQSKYWGSFQTGRKDNWTFGDKKTGSHMIKFIWINIQRHPLITKKSSPDDPSLKDYWEKRRTKNSKSEVEKFNKKSQRIISKQNHKCPVCGQTLYNNEPLHLHHIIPKSEGGKDTLNNLVYLHTYCHHKTHFQKE